jgi:predicted polyphosphate/ATP-dependent NAD kinase
VTSPALGLVVNPVAGMGGRVGLHGTDDAALDQARARGAEPVAPARARRALERLHRAAPRLAVLTVDGPMGTDHLAALEGWEVSTVAGVPGHAGRTDGADTGAAAAAMAEAGVRLVLFVGGDGTARDVARGLAPTGTAVLGVPAGVKMHSGVFGVTPEAAGDAAARFLADARASTRTAEVVDRDADGAVRLHATVEVPLVPQAVQAAKGGAGGAAPLELTGLAREVVAETPPGRLLLLGPGTTVAAVGDALGVPTTPLGVDAVLDGTLVASDASEAELLTLLAQHPDAALVLGVVGGQGFLLGRGNQQLSPAVLRAVGTDRIEVLATPDKVAALHEPVLHVDVDDPDLAARLVGYHRVRTGRARSTVLRIVA